MRDKLLMRMIISIAVLMTMAILPMGHMVGAEEVDISFPDIDGIITSDQTWSGTQTFGQVSIQIGATVTVSPGTVLENYDSSSFINVEGYLNAIGTEGSPIVFGFKINPLVLILSQLLDNLFNFFFAFVILLIPFWMYYSTEITGAIFLPFAIVVMIAGLWGMTWFLAILNVFFRDTKFVVQFSTSVIFFLTPVFYPVEFVPEKYRWLIDINPIYALIAPFRCCIYNFSIESFSVILLKGALVSTAFLGLAHFYWRKKRNEFYLYL